MKNNADIHLLNVEFSKSRFKTYFGNIGEMIAEEVLVQEGFQVWGLKPYHSGVKREQSEFCTLYECLIAALNETQSKNIRDLAQRELASFFGDKYQSFLNYMDSIGVFGKTGIVGACRLSALSKKKVTHVYSPDLVVGKGADIYIVEVKTNSGDIYLKPEKLKGLISAKDYSLIPLLININVNINASNFRLQEL